MPQAHAYGHIGVTKVFNVQHPPVKGCRYDCSVQDADWIRCPVGEHLLKIDHSLWSSIVIHVLEADTYTCEDVDVALESSKCEFLIISQTLRDRSEQFRPNFLFL